LTITSFLLCEPTSAVGSQRLFLLRPIEEGDDDTACGSDDGDENGVRHAALHLKTKCLRKNVREIIPSVKGADTTYRAFICDRADFLPQLAAGAVAIYRGGAYFASARRFCHERLGEQGDGDGDQCQHQADAGTEAHEFVAEDNEWMFGSSEVGCMSRKAEAGSVLVRVWFA
jgi:hypothetical protein